jgi:hypothetical protein
MKRSMIAAVCGVAVAIRVVGFCSPVSAAILFDSLTIPDSFAEYSDPINTGPFAGSFSTVDAFVLRDVKVLLSGDNTSKGSITVSLLSDVPASPPAILLPHPGALLYTIGTLPDSRLTSLPSVFDFPVSSGVNLTASTRYWIELSTTDASTAAWSWTLDYSGHGVAIEYALTPNGVSSNDPMGPYQMQVSDTVPEPCTLVVWSLLGACGMGVRWMRRKRAA